MPILKHAKKKLKQDKKRTLRNRKVKEAFRVLIKQAKADKAAESVSKAFSSIDKAAKQNILPKNKAARMKSALSKFVASDQTVSPAAAKKAKKKAAPKKAATKKTPAKNK